MWKKVQTGGNPCVGFPVAVSLFAGLWPLEVLLALAKGVDRAVSHGQP